MVRMTLETIRVATNLTQEELASIVSKDLSPVEQLLVWRITALEEKLTRQDRDGELSTLVKSLTRDLNEHEEGHKEVAKEQKVSRRWLISIVVTLVVPLYPLVGVLILRK